MEIFRSAFSNVKNLFSKDLIAIFGIVFISIIIFITNYTPGTYLVGWDNIMPELGHKFNLLRSLTSVWQEYRGLGVIDIMGHGANIIHSIQIFILDLVLPNNMVRFAFNILMHLLGGIGIFFLVKKLMRLTPLAFLAAVFYMLNIGIVQMFFAPLEVFTVHFAALPFMTLAVLNSLENNSRKSYLILFLTSLFFLQQGFVPTVFLVFLIYLTVLLALNLISKKQIRPVIFTGLIIFSVNALWLLPFIYSTLTHASVIESTRINQFSSGEIFFRNKEFGNLFDVLRGHGFMLNTIEYDTFTSQNIYFMDIFRKLSTTLIYNIIQVVLIALTLFGLAFAVIKRNKKLYPFVAIFAISFFFLANNVFMLESMNNFVRENIPLFGEAFRFPFTKFITIFMFAYSILLAYGVGAIAALIYQLTKKVSFKKIILVLSLVFSIGIASLTYPIFSGNFFSPYLRLSVPDVYSQTYEYFNNQDKNKRILVLPMQTFWNWQYANWGHRGSGFLWHGIEQPLLLRAFDPWSQKNEQLYNEFSYAINTQNEEQFNNLLTKYDISYVLIDKSIINTLSNSPINYDKLSEFIDKSNVKRDRDLGQIIIYKNTKSVSFISTLSLKNTVKTSSKYTSNYIDPLIKDTTNYIYDSNSPDIKSVFNSISTLKLPEDSEFSITENDTQFILKPKNFESNIKDSTLILPSIYKYEFLIPIKVTTDGAQIQITPIYPQVIVNGKNVTVPTDTITLPSPVGNPTEIILEDTAHAIRLDGKDIGYVLNNIPNSITIKNATDQATIQLDLTDREGANSFVKLDAPINSVEIIIEKGSGTLTNWNVIPTKNYVIKDVQGELSKDKNSYTKIDSNESITITSQNDAKEIAYYDKDLFHRGSYIVTADINLRSGLRPNFYVDNPEAGRAETETKLTNGKNYIIVPPTDAYDKGYGFHITVKSEGTEVASTTINRLGMFPIPLETITNMRIFNSNSSVFTQTPPEKTPLEFTKYGTFYYQISNTSDSIIALSQAQNSGWNAYLINQTDNNSPLSAFKKAFPFIFGKKIDKSGLINNWANGWDTTTTSHLSDPTSQIIIVFLPQYLQFLGYFIMAFALLVIIFKSKLSIIAVLKSKFNGYFDNRTESLKTKIHSMKAARTKNPELVEPLNPSVL